jgi:hypothetical protein
LPFIGFIFGYIDFFTQIKPLKPNNHGIQNYPQSNGRECPSLQKRFFYRIHAFDQKAFYAVVQYPPEKFGAGQTSGSFYVLFFVFPNTAFA